MAAMVAGTKSYGKCRAKTMNAFVRRLSSSSIPTRLSVFLIAMAWSSLAFGGEIHDAPTNSQPASPSVKTEEYELIKDNDELGVIITVNSTSVELNNTGDGDVQGKVTSFFLGGEELQLATDDIVHESGKSWVVTKKYGRIGIGGRFVSGESGHGELCVWLTPSQVTSVKKSIQNRSTVASFVVAARDGNLKKVKALLKGNPDLVFNKDTGGLTALHYAAESGYRDVVELLLANNADVNAKDDAGNTRLHLVAKFGRKDVGELLIAHRAEYDVFDVSAVGDTEKIKALLTSNPNLIFSKDKQGETPLHLAAAFGYKDVADLLLTNHADVNAKDNNGMTPLHMAAGQDRREVVELLLANKVDVNVKDNLGKMPLNYAAMKGYEGIAELLRQHGGYD